MAGQLQRVSSPDFTPLQYGLWSVVQDRSADLNARWRSGVHWQPICGTAATTYDECLVVTGTGGPPPPPVAKAATHTLAPYGAQPFTVFAEVDCSPVGYINDPDEKTNAENAARVALTQTELVQVERAFWTGMDGSQNVVFPHLAANAAFTNGGIIMQMAATTVTGSTILDVVEGLGYLESRLNSCFGGQGVIHVPEIVYPSLVANHQLVQVGGPNGPQLRTTKGNLVAIGAGYPGTSPTGTLTSNAVWLYGTGPVFAYRGMEPAPDSNLHSDYRIRDWFDRSNNTMKVIAERTYLLGYDCCLFAVQVSLGGVVTGQPLSAF